MVQKSEPEKANGPAGAPDLTPELLKKLQTHMTEDKKASRHDLVSDETTAVPVQNRLEASNNTGKETKTEDDDGLSTPENDAAVDDIVRNEGDEVLAHEDAQKKPEQPQVKGFWRKIGNFFADWWHNKWARWITIVVLLVALATLAAVPTARYAVLNFFGVRASVTVTVSDNITHLPLKNFVVTVDDNQDTTNSNGAAKVRYVKLGKHTLTIKRFGYKAITQEIVVGWGSNPLAPFYAVATGAQYTLTVKDYVSENGISNAEADSGQASALADKKGIITLTLDDNATTADATVQAPGYRSQQLHIDLTKSTTGSILLVPSAKAVYMTKQDNQYNLVARYINGEGQNIILAGTGRETGQMVVAVDPAHTHAAVVSTRDAIRDNDGYLLSTLTVVGLNGGSQTVAHAQQIKLIDWIGSKLIFEEAIAGASASNNQRYKLIAYDYNTNAQIQLANANQFNSVLSAQGLLYYAVSSTDPNVHAAFWRVKPDGSSRQNINNTETWTAFRTNYNTISLQTPNGWFNYAINGSGGTQQTSQPQQFQNRVYVPGGGTQSAWIDSNGDQGVLKIYDTSSGKDKTVHSQKGLGQPLYWLNNQTVVVRIAVGQEIADYAVSVSNGHIKKVADVVNTSGLAPTN